VTTTAPGRPRSEETTRAILDAALALVDEVGYAGCSMERIAQKAGVQKPAVYRRWCNKSDLVADAVHLVAMPITDPDTGSVEGDLVAMMREMKATAGTPEGKVALRLLAEHGAHPDLVAAIKSSMIAKRRVVFRRVLKRGEERGEIRAGIDVDLVVQMLLGPILVRLLIKHEGVPASLPPATVRLLLAGLQA
jgi:AcrR family transcriptional regulator